MDLEILALGNFGTEKFRHYTKQYGRFGKCKNVLLCRNIHFVKLSIVEMSSAEISPSHISTIKIKT
jgi:hypothetical protein